MKSSLRWQLSGHHEEKLYSYIFEDRKQSADTCLKRSQIPGQGDLPEFYNYRDWEKWQGKLVGIKTIFINYQVLKYFNTDRDKNQLREEQSIWPSGDCPVVHSSSSKTK